MILEEYIDKGILLSQILDASRRTPITFDNGEILVNGERFGTGICNLFLDDIQKAIDAAYAVRPKE